MARQISISNEVYDELSKKKGKKSFSEVIKEALGIKKNEPDVWKFFGAIDDNEADKLRASSDEFRSNFRIRRTAELKKAHGERRASKENRKNRKLAYA
jgi:predicted CopG family antitoxin